MVAPAIEQLLLEEEEAAERLAARVRLAIIGGLFTIQGYLLFSGVEDRTDALVGVVASVVAVTYGGGVWVWLRLGYRSLISYVSVGLDVALVTGVALASGLIPNQVTAATKSPYTLLYFLIIATAGLRQRPGLAYFAAVLSVAGYLLIFMAAAVVAPGRVTPCLSCDFASADVSPVRIATVAALLLLAGALTAATTRRTRDLLGRAVGRQVLLVAMERYFPEKEALQVIASGRELQEGGERRDVTVLVADIRGFTTLSEKTAPDQMVKLLNTYFEEMVEAIFEQQGTLMSFVGDALWAVFGLPNPRPDDADRALAAARAMRDRLEGLNRRAEFEAIGGIRIGVGMHSGEVVVGNIGSTRRLEYGVIGDTVNTTARVEELNKRLGTDVLVSESTAVRLTDREGLADRGELAIRGREQTLRVFAVEARRARVESAP